MRKLRRATNENPFEVLDELRKHYQTMLSVNYDIPMFTVDLLADEDDKIDQAKLTSVRKLILDRCFEILSLPIPSLVFFFSVQKFKIKCDTSLFILQLSCVESELFQMNQPNRFVYLHSKYTGRANHTPDRFGHFFSHSVILKDVQRDFPALHFFNQFNLKK